MNKLKVTIAGMLIACLSIGVMNAQDKSATAPAPKVNKKAAPAKDAKPAANGQHLKKDGTPDMRYKENKSTAKPAATTPATKPGAEKAHPKKAAPAKASDNKKM